jgi:hypothetical protein
MAHYSSQAHALFSMAQNLKNHFSQTIKVKLKN